MILKRDELHTTFHARHLEYPIEFLRKIIISLLILGKVSAILGKKHYFRTRGIVHLVGIH